MQLMLGDCLERMKEIPDGSVDLILTDPPYNIAKDNNFTQWVGLGLTLEIGIKDLIYSHT